MSGGVDSSVSAYLLKERGFDVSGVFIETWHPEGFPCNEKEERRDAMRVAAHLNVPLYIADAKKQYKKYVADEMIREYKAGRTPNPDILCNKFVKFSTLFEIAKKLGADFVATGHYARISVKNDEAFLSEPKDSQKDQTYFLWAVPPEDLEKVIFPLEALTKKEVRALAKKAGIPVAEKKDSQGICFLGPLDLKEYLKISIREKKGSVLDEAGRKIGTHNGVWFYTEGERHGFRVEHETSDDEPLYILKKDIKRNVLVVGPQKSLAREYTLKLSNVSISYSNVLKNIRIGKEGISCEARFRYRQPKQKVKLFRKGKSPTGEWYVSVKSPSPIAAGQSVVFYSGRNILGGAIVSGV